jgi:predicted amidohydrolase
LITEHAEKAYQNAANVYLASVAKSAKGIEKAYHHYPIIAKKYNMIVMMVNCIGYCDNFLSVGKTAIWSKNGELLAQLDDKNEGVLILNTDNQEVFSEMI